MTSPHPALGIDYGSPHRHCRHGLRGHHGPSRRNHPQASDGRNFPHCPARPETGNTHPGAGSSRPHGPFGKELPRPSGAFRRNLGAALPGLPLIFMDECLTTVIAQEKLHAAGKNAKNFRPVIDQVAAVEILNTWLDSRQAGNQQRAARPSALRSYGTPYFPFPEQDHSPGKQKRRQPTPPTTER